MMQESDLMRKNTRPKGNSPQRAASKHIRPNRRPNTKSRDSNRQSRQHSRRLSSHQTSTSSPKDSLANEEDPEEPSVLVSKFPFWVMLCDPNVFVQLRSIRAASAHTISMPDHERHANKLGLLILLICYAIRATAVSSRIT